MTIFVSQMKLGFQTVQRSQIPFTISNINSDSSAISVISSASFTASAAANDLWSASATQWEAMLVAPSSVPGSNNSDFLEFPGFASLCLDVGILEPEFLILKHWSTCNQVNTS